MKAVIYQYTDLSEYLHAIGSCFSLKGRPLSHSQWAKKLRYRSRRTIGMVLSGKKPASADLLERIGKLLNLSAKEQLYLRELAKLGRTEEPQKRTEILSELSRLRPKHVERKLIAAEQFNYIAHWYNLVVRQLISAPGVDGDPEKISQMLGGAVSPMAIAKSLQRMVQLNLLRQRADGKGYDISSEPLTTSEDIPVAAIRQHHHEQINRALDALYKQRVEEREFLGLTLRFNPEDTLLAKKFLRETVDEFDSRFASKESKQVYQLNLQFFCHTKGMASDEK